MYLGVVFIFFVTRIFFCTFCDFLKNEIGNSEKNMHLRCHFPAKFYYKIRFFSNFPHLLGVPRGVENCKNLKKLHRVGWKNGNVKISLDPVGVFTKYRSCNAPKWPQMPQKWIRTIPFCQDTLLEFPFLFSKVENICQISFSPLERGEMKFRFLFLLSKLGK